MSEKAVSNEQDTTKQAEGSNQEAKEQFVNRSAYEDVTKDMHKYKAKVRDTEAKLNEYATKLKAIEEQKLKDQEKWQELYEREKNERERLTQERENDKNLYLRSVKMSALKQELGGQVKDEYLSFADLDSIELKEDGSLSSDSVHAVANDFRQNHPGLVSSNSNSGITSVASPTNSAVQTKETKSLEQMSIEEKAELLKTLKNI